MAFHESVRLIHSHHAHWFCGKCPVGATPVSRFMRQRDWPM
jgi:hypothetical protein